MSPQLKSFEGPDVQLVLDRIRQELGPAAKISGAEKIRVGGVLGFFAKERFRVLVEVPDSGDAVEPTESAGAATVADAGPDHRPSPLPTPRPAQAAPTTDVFSAMAEATDDVNDVADVTDGTDGGQTTAEPRSFDAVLARVATTLENSSGPMEHGPGISAPTATGNGLDVGTGYGSFSARPDPRPSDALIDSREPAQDIASGAALYLAETTVPAPRPPEPEPGPGLANPPLAAPSFSAPAVSAPSAEETAEPEMDDGVAGVLRRTGIDYHTVTRMAAALRAGTEIHTVLHDAFSRLEPAPPLPRQAGGLLVVVGAGSTARRLGAALADEMEIDPAQVPFASRHAEAHAVATGTLLLRSAEDAAERAPGWRRSHPAVVVVDAPVTGAERSWAVHVIAALRPTSVWGVVDATSKTEDIAAWAAAVGGVDALALDGVDATASPAAALDVGIPVARLDGQPATTARWTATIVDRIQSCT